MLQVITKDQAVACVREQLRSVVPKTETAALNSALNRVLSQDVVSNEDIPPFDRTTVDGYAVCAADTFGAGAAIPAELEIVGEIAMGKAPQFALRRGQCAKISTGGMLPASADAAVMVEHTDDANGLCLVYAGVSPGANVTRRGDDVAKGDCVLQKGMRIGIPETGVLAALGVYDVPVFVPPTVAVISTGDEIVTGTPTAGQMRDVNTFLLAAAAQRFGCRVVQYGAVPDDREQIEAAVRSCLDKADAVLISGGSSAGVRDLTVDILDTLGKVYFHGIAMKPGKPTIFAMAKGKPVFGLPGHPLAAYFVFRLIVCEGLRAMLSLPEDRPASKGTLAVNIPSNHGREEYLCVRRRADGTVLPLHTKSGVISVLTQADGFLRIPRDAEGLAKGAEIDLYEV
ncbi:MAG: molybdopterin molybdotransferase MoeA [Clostridia bacterium]|nr:molybdopterin molybdotransferase MoeA [Clostridia bacterium]